MPRRLRASRRAWRSACWQVAGSVSPGVAAFGTAAPSPSAHTPGMPSTASVSSTRTRPCSSSGRPSSREQRVRRHARGPHDRLGLDAPPAGQLHAAGVDGLERGLGQDLDPAPGERARGEARELLRHLAEDPRRAVDEHPAGLDVGQSRVAAQRAGRQLLQLGERLDAGEAGAGEHEREPALGRLGRGVGEVDLAQHVVAQADRVADVLEREGVLAQAGRRRACG